MNPHTLLSRVILNYFSKYPARVFRQLSTNNFLGVGVKKTVLVMASALLVAGFAICTKADTEASRLDFDSQGHFLMHGVPQFLLGVYDSGLGYFNDAKSYDDMLFGANGKRGLGDMPINMYLNFYYGEAPNPAMAALMQALDNHGIMYLQTANCFQAGSYKRLPFSTLDDGNVKAFSASRAAAGYYVMDECDDSLVGETTDHTNHLHLLDPEGKTFAALYSASYRDYSLWKNAADILAVDPYPLYNAEPQDGYAHFKVADQIARLRRAVPPSRPIVAVLQFFQFTLNARLPTYDEMRAHAVMSIVEGAQGIMWWQLGPGGLRKSTDPAIVAGAMDNLKKLVQELAGLQAALVAEPHPEMLVKNSTEVGDPIAWRKSALLHNMAVNPLYSDKEAYKAELDALSKGDTSLSYMLNQSGPIRTRVNIVGGKGYLFAYNYTNQNMPVTFTWRDNISSVIENGEKRNITANGNSFSDTFSPYAARIYIVSSGESKSLTSIPETPNLSPRSQDTSLVPSASAASPSSGSESSREGGGKGPSVHFISVIFPPTLTPTTLSPSPSQRSITRNLFYGSRGDDVRAIQQLLIRSNFLAAGFDTGFFGKLTFAAVKRFQSAHGLPSTGFFGPLSRQLFISLIQ